MDALLRRVRAPLLAAAALLAWTGAAHASSVDPTPVCALAGGIRGALDALAGRWTAADSTLDAGPLARLERSCLGTGRQPIAVVNRAGAACRLPPEGYASPAGGLGADAREIARWWHGEGGRERVKASADEATFRTASDAVEAWNDVRLDEAIALVQGRLDRFEVKYGPGSPRLNIVEVGLNAWLQGAGWFAPNDRGPSPNEVLLGYSTSWATIADDEATPASTLELGLRRYNLDWREGRSGWAALLRPRYVSVGVVVAEERDGALRWPLRGAQDRTTRAGPFVSMGDLKAAYLFGPHARLMVSRQIQLLPGLF